MRYTGFLLAGLLALGGSTVCAQTHSTEDSVRDAVDLLFYGMKSSTAAIIRKSFTDSAILQTIASPEGRVVTEKVKDFAEIVGKMTSGDADERIAVNDLVIRIDGPLAIVWAPYEFYYKGQFSHRGIDSFQLVRVNGVWKIQYLIDTRRK